jgi:hypothetical protein
MDITSLSWEDYHQMEKPVIRLESLINFKPNQRVYFNPDATGYVKPSVIEKAKNRELIVAKVLWDKKVIRCIDLDSGNAYYYDYRNLLIK